MFDSLKLRALTDHLPVTHVEAGRRVYKYRQTEVIPCVRRGGERGRRSPHRGVVVSASVVCVLFSGVLIFIACHPRHPSVFAIHGQSAGERKVGECFESSWSFQVPRLLYTLLRLTVHLPRHSYHSPLSFASIGEIMVFF